MKKHYKSFLRSIFFPIYFLFIVVNIPLNASLNTEEQSDSEKKSQASRAESQLSLAVKSIIEDSSKEIASVGNSLETIQKNLSTALSKQSTDILGADKVLRQNISISKEKISTATSRLEQVNQAPTPSLTKGSSLGKIITLESLDASLAKEGFNVSWGHNAGNIQSLIHSRHTSTCKCAYWAEIVLSFRETLQEKDFYKSAYERQKTHLDLSKKAYEDIRGIKTNLDTAEEKGNQALMALQNERSAFQSQAEKITATVQMASQLVSNRESFKNKLIELVSKSEEEQRIEKEELKNKLTQKENILEEKNQKFIEDYKEKDKSANEYLQKKDNIIQDSHNEVKELLKEKLTDADKVAQEKLQLAKELGSIQGKSQSDLFSLQKTIAAQEAKIRSTVPMLFLKLCTKAEIKGDKRKNYLGALKNKELSIIDLLEKAEEFLADDDFE